MAAAKKEAEEDEVSLLPMKVRHTDMPHDLLLRVQKIITLAMQEFSLEKDVASGIKDYCDRDAALNSSKEGAWQCIVGSKFACSVTQNADWIAFVDVLTNQQTVLVFRSR